MAEHKFRYPIESMNSGKEGKNMNKTRTYGNERTQLTLTEKAEMAYNNSDYRITEFGAYLGNGNWERTYDITTASGQTVCEEMTEAEVNEWLEELADEEAEEVLRISRINIKSETFCTSWNGKLYCVDICEDAEERSAWLYNANYGVKMLMWGEEVEQSNRDEYLDLVFSNLPDYIEDYEEEYE